MVADGLHWRHTNSTTKQNDHLVAVAHKIDRNGAIRSFEENRYLLLLLRQLIESSSPSSGLADVERDDGLQWAGAD